jgi:YHS domain-containing protein
MKKLLSLTTIIAVSALSHLQAADAPATPPTPDQLKTCPVSGEKLGEMGKPLIFTYQGQEVKLCCSGCKKDFDKDPAKYIKLIRAADQK